MALQIRRGTDAQRQTIAFKSGELIYTTDLKDMWVGDGVTNGGTQLSPVKSVNGSTGTVVLTTDQVTQGSTNKYYTAVQAKIDAGAALVAGNGGNTGITFSYNSGTNVINAVLANAGGLSAVVGDPNPSLGGNLTLNSKNIVGTGVINMTGAITSTSLTAGTVTATNLVMSTTTIDSNTFTFSGSNNLLTLANGALKVSTGVADNFKGIYLYGTSISSTTTSTSINNYSSRGTVASPTISVNGDIINAYSTNTYNGTVYKESGALFFTVDGTVTSGGEIPSRFTLMVGDGTNALGSVAMTFKKSGELSAPIFKTGSYTTTQMNAIATPSAGMIIFNTTASDFYGYNGSAWVAFVGP